MPLRAWSASRGLPSGHGTPGPEICFFILDRLSVLSRRRFGSIARVLHSHEKIVIPVLVLTR